MDAPDYPLLIKNLLLVPLRQPSGHGILYRDLARTDYKTFGERVGRLGSARAALGLWKGDTVAVMDWDTPAPNEAFKYSPREARCWA
jgi:fatty-acyl-CoA synthase